MKTIYAFIIALTAFVGSASAVDVISVNFTDGASPSAGTEITGTYGVESAGNWNNIAGPTSNLIDSNGVATTVSVSATTRPNGNSTWPSDYSGTVLYAGIVEYLNQSPNSSATISGLNANFPDGYKIIVYLNGTSTLNAGQVSDGTTTYYYKTYYSPSNFDGTLTQTLDEEYVAGEGTSVPVAQYAVFGTEAVPLTADSITLTMDALLGGGASLCGFQIVGVEAISLPEGVVFYDDFSAYTDGDGKVPPTRSNPWDWDLVLSSTWSGLASDYIRSDWGSLFVSTNNTGTPTFAVPADVTGGVAAKIGYSVMASGTNDYYEDLTINTGVGITSDTNYTVTIRAMIKSQSGDTTDDATAVGQLRLSCGYYNAEGTNFVSTGLLNVTTLSATEWTEMTVGLNGSAIPTNALDGTLIVRMDRGSFTNTTDYLTYVDYIQVDAEMSTPWTEWRDSYGLSGTDAEKTADADGDGFSNLAEWAVGGDPTDAADAGFKMNTLVAEGNFLVIYPRQTQYAANGLDYQLETTDDLVGGVWTNDSAATFNPAVLGVTTNGYTTGFDAVTNVVGAISSSEKQFIRLRIEDLNN